MKEFHFEAILGLFSKDPTPPATPIRWPSPNLRYKPSYHAKLTLGGYTTWRKVTTE